MAPYNRTGGHIATNYLFPWTALFHKQTNQIKLLSLGKAQWLPPAKMSVEGGMQIGKERSGEVYLPRHNATSVSQWFLAVSLLLYRWDGSRLLWQLRFSLPFTFQWQGNRSGITSDQRPLLISLCEGRDQNPPLPPLLRILQSLQSHASSSIVVGFLPAESYPEEVLKKGFKKWRFGERLMDCLPLPSKMYCLLRTKAGYRQIRLHRIRFSIQSVQQVLHKESEKCSVDIRSR